MLSINQVVYPGVFETNQDVLNLVFKMMENHAFHFEVIYSTYYDHDFDFLI